MTMRKYVVYLPGLGGFYCGLQPIRDTDGKPEIVPRTTSDPTEAKTYLPGDVVKDRVGDVVKDRVGETLCDAGLVSVADSMLVMSYDAWESPAKGAK